MTRLPVPGGDDNAWGVILNDFLAQAHNTDGTLKSSIVGDAQITDVAQSKVTGLSAALAAKTNDTVAVHKGDLVFNVKDYGAVGDGVTDDTTALRNACVAASAVYGQVFLPPGIYVVTGTLSLSGCKCSIIGSGASYSTGGGAKPVGTVIKAVTQTGPVLDFTGFVWPGDYRGRLRFENFIVQGDGTAGTAKKGIYIPAAQFPINTSWRDLSVTLTGGIAIDVSDIYLSLFEAVTVTTPVSSVANDVPYVRFAGANGMRINGLGLRSTVFGGTDDVPASGALRLEATAFQMHDALLNGCWLENLHIGDQKAAVITQTNGVIISDFQVFDTYKVSGATETAIIRMEAAGVLNAGGNIVRGIIPGHGTNATDYDYGVKVMQSNNRIEGVKGYRGANVKLETGVTGCYIHLGGSYSTGSVAGVVDNSGNTTNTIIDDFLGSHVYGASSGSATLTMNGATIRAGTGTPEAAVVGAVGDIFLRTDGTPGSTLYSKSNFGGSNVGWHSTVVEHLGTATLSVNQSIPLTTAPNWKYTLGANITFTTVLGSRTGAMMTIMLTQDATGSRLVTWPAVFKWAGNTAPTLSTTPNVTDSFVFMYDGTNWRELSRAMGST